MKVLQITKPGTAEIIDRPTPGPDSSEALLEIESIATCPHWDRHIFEGEPMFEGMIMDYPFWPGKPGHEAIGRVLSCDNPEYKHLVGKRVAVWRDRGPYCEGLYGTHGLVPAENLLAIPENLPADKITSLELAMCVQVSIDQLNEINAIKGRKVALTGLGPGGLVALQLLKHAGAAEIWAIDPQEDRRTLALKLGADRAIAPGDPALPAARTDEDAFYAALDTTGLVKAIEPMMKRCRRALAVFGVVREPITVPVDMWYGGFSLICYGEHNRQAAERALNAILDGALDLAPLYTHAMPLSRYADAVKLLQEMKAIKVLFDPKS